MEIRQLEAFAAVYSARSVTAAGRLLERSQPMVSRQIQDLEQELGFTLFTRTRPQVTLTPQGQEFYQEVHNVLAGLQQLDNRAREIARGRSRSLRISATYALGSALLPPVMGQLESTTPVFEYRMSIETTSPSQVVQAVADGVADVGLVSLPLDLGRCKLEWSGEAPCVLALPIEHPLAVQDVVCIGDLGNNTVITMWNKSGLRHRLSTALLQGQSGKSPRRYIETTSSINSLLLVRAGVGVALMDPFTAAAIPMEGVVYRAVDRHLPYMMGVVTHRDRALPEEGSYLIKALWDYSCLHVPGFTSGDPSGLPQ